MANYKAALADLMQQTKPNISATSVLYKVDRTTLERRFHGTQGTKEDQYEKARLLNNAQEAVLVKHINELTRKGIPPTPAMVHSFAAEMIEKEPGKNWVTGFLGRHVKELESKYLQPLDKNRKVKAAESYRDIELFYDSLKQKMTQYNILPENSYNVDEKGQMIGFMQLEKSKRIFTKGSTLEKKLVGNGNMHDGSSQQWITILACICADGTVLPPALIYKAVSGNLLEDTSWLQDDLEPSKDAAFFTSSPTGWTDNKLGLAWLKEVFDRHTKDKARGRQWRLLILDGHGSYVTLLFIEWALQHKILVCVFPPHTTHRLQPLDVKVFGPLASYYSTNLSKHMMHSQLEGPSAISQRDFFRLFWPAWHSATTEKNISSGWHATGLFPLDASVVLSKHPKPKNAHDAEVPEGAAPRPASSASSTGTVTDYSKIHAMITDALTTQDSRKVRELQLQVHQLTSKLAIATAENEGFKRALINAKR